MLIPGFPRSFAIWWRRDRVVEVSRSRDLSPFAFAVVLLCMSSPSWAAGEAEKEGEQLAAMLARGEPAGRIEVRWESSLDDLDQTAAFVALESFLRHGLEDPLARLSAAVGQLSEKQAESRLQALAKLAQSRPKASRSHLIAIETGISELADLLRTIEKGLGESPSRSELRRQRASLETLGRTSRELRRSARQEFDAR